MGYDVRQFSTLAHDYTTYQIWSKKSGDYDARLVDNPFSGDRDLSLRHAAMLEDLSKKDTRSEKYFTRYFVFEVHDMVRQIN